ncbi:MAG TPA: hypothetical protein VFJ74_13975 [Gemmatimonadaceae bacterium]|nr:hypothetical protein [Gemmatimonadaceae bacterium]
MRNPQALLLAVATLSLGACNPFHKAPVTEVTHDANANARWRASLVTPATLVGAVQINGAATMQPGRNSQDTDFSLNVANATPGGVHPWQVHRGQCGDDQGVLGSAGAYRAIKVGDDGRGTATATVPMTTPSTGNYYVTVQASAANPETVVACGNLAPPAI